MDSTKKFKGLSFCTGSRGLEKGIERSGFEVVTVAYVEIEAFQIVNLVGEMEKGLVAPAPIWSNIKTFDSNPFRDRIHLITAGYPCQPFSSAGKRQGAKDKRHLWPYIWHAVKTIKPLLCFFENVDGHVSMGFREVFKSLRCLGYSVEAGLFTACEVGAPHTRKRLFIVACSNPRELRRCLADPGSKYGSMAKVAKRGFENATPNGGNVSNISIKGLQIRDEQFKNVRKDRKQQGGKYSGVYTPNELPNPDSIRNRKNSKRIKTRVAFENGDKWPARPGLPQFEWEEPRTVEPGVGCTIDGYNFRTDLLRMYGNAVVEQTAELAFETLIKKLFNTIDRS